MKHSTSVWARFCAWFAGDRLAILGPQTSGKTVFYRFLESGFEERLDPGRYEATINKHRMSGIRIKNPEGEQSVILLKKSYDVGGTEDHIDDWKLALKSADRVLYFFNLAKVLTDQQASLRFVYDSQNLEQFFNPDDAKSRRKKLKSFHLIGSFCDCMPGYNEERPDIWTTDFSKQMRDNVFVRQFCLIARHWLRERSDLNLHVGSLLTLKSREHLLTNIFDATK